MDERHEILPSEEIKRRIAEKAALVAELEARNVNLRPGPMIEVDALPVIHSTPARRITADASTLARLVKAATRADKRAMQSAEIANADRIEAMDARAALDAYMRENGLV